MGIVVDRFLQSEIESIGGSPAPDARDPRSETRSLVGSTYCSTRPSTTSTAAAGSSLLAASETCGASRRDSPASPSGTRRDPSLVTITPDVVASYADERRAEKKDESGTRAGDPTDSCYCGKPSHRSDSGNLKRS